MENKEILSIVLTGGPYSGKSSMIPEIKVFFERRGYNVILVGETSREITNTIPNWQTFYTNVDFQKAFFIKQLEKETTAQELAKKCKEKKVVIIYDKALLDIKAYLDKHTFDTIRKSFNFENTKDILKRYDCVIHLETLAKINPKKYHMEYSPIRTAIQDADDIDRKINNAWFLHPHHIFIGASNEFEEKIDMTLYLLNDFLEKNQNEKNKK